MTVELFHSDSYLRSCEGVVLAIDGQEVVFDQTVFYPRGGGQPGDTGSISWDHRSAAIIDTFRADSGAIVHVLEEGADVPYVGARVFTEINWNRRYRHMRMHTAMHLLGSVLKYSVTGGGISAEKSRLDFHMLESVDKKAVTDVLQDLVRSDHSIGSRSISEEELDANPDLVRTMSVQPPRGRGEIRLLEIEGVDLQPCGGTHVRSTSEVGNVRIGKIKRKNQQDLRIYIHLDD